MDSLQDDWISRYTIPKYSIEEYVKEKRQFSKKKAEYYRKQIKNFKSSSNVNEIYKVVEIGKNIMYWDGAYDAFDAMLDYIKQQ